MKSKMWKRTVPLVAALALAVTIVVLAMPGAMAAAGGGTFVQAGWTLWTDGTNQQMGCTQCYLRIVDNNTGAVTVFKTGDSFGSYHWAVLLPLGHEYHFYVEEGAFCSAFSNPWAPANIDWPPNSTHIPTEPADGGVGIRGLTLTYLGKPGWLCPE